MFLTHDFHVFRLLFFQRPYGTVLGYGRGCQGLEVSKLIVRLSDFDAKFILSFSMRVVGSNLRSPTSILE